MGAHYLASSISYPINIHNDDTGANDNDDSRSFETPIITVITLLVIQWSQQQHQIYQNFYTWKNIFLKLKSNCLSIKI